jgi:hypothetical protein
MSSSNKNKKPSTLTSGNNNKVSVEQNKQKRNSVSSLKALKTGEVSESDGKQLLKPPKPRIKRTRSFVNKFNDFLTLFSPASSNLRRLPQITHSESAEIISTTSTSATNLKQKEPNELKIDKKTNNSDSDKYEKKVSAKLPPKSKVRNLSFKSIDESDSANQVVRRGHPKSSFIVNRFEMYLNDGDDRSRVSSSKLDPKSLSKSGGQLALKSDSLPGSFEYFSKRDKSVAVCFLETKFSNSKKKSIFKIS